jgi:hypothetical protein
MEGDPTARRRKPETLSQIRAELTFILSLVLLQRLRLKDLQMPRLQELGRIGLRLRQGRDIQDEAQVEHARVVLHVSSVHVFHESVTNGFLGK